MQTPASRPNNYYGCWLGTWFKRIWKNINKVWLKLYTEMNQKEVSRNKPKLCPGDIFQEVSMGKKLQLPMRKRARFPATQWRLAERVASPALEMLGFL